MLVRNPPGVMDKFIIDLSLHGNGHSFNQHYVHLRSVEQGSNKYSHLEITMM